MPGFGATVEILGVFALRVRMPGALVSHMLCFDVLWHHALSLAFLFSKAGVPSLPRFCGYGTEKVSNILLGSNNLVAM